MIPKTISPSQALEDAFYAFNEVSAQLAETYRSLQERVNVLNQELAATRSDRLKQLAEKESLTDRLQRLLEALPAGVVVLDCKGIVCDCNPVAHEMLGKPLIGESWLHIKERVFEHFDDQDVVLCNGRRLSISSRRLLTESGHILLLSDVSEAYAMTEMVNRHKRLSAMGEMLARLAHQVRTPLATVLLLASNLHRTMGPEKEHLKGVEKIIQHLRQLDRMVNDMLVFARGGDADLEEVDVAVLLENLRHHVLPHLQARAGKLSIINLAKHAVIKGSYDALLGAMLNLVTNAIQASAHECEITIAVSQAETNILQIEVRDNGIGIPADVIDHIFEPFFTTRSSGTGLGLAVVNSVVQSHQGTLKVQSTPGAGASFTLSLPLSQRDVEIPGVAWDFLTSGPAKAVAKSGTKSAC